MNNSEFTDDSVGSSSYTEGAPNRIREQVRSSASAIRGQIDATRKTIAGEAAAAGRTVMQEVTGTFTRKMDQVRASAAGSLSRASENLEQRAARVSSPKYRAAGEKLAFKMRSASDYVRNSSVSDTAADVRASMARHPGKWVLGALAVGFFTGLMTRSTGSSNGSRMVRSHVS